MTLLLSQLHEKMCGFGFIRTTLLVLFLLTSYWIPLVLVPFVVLRNDQPFNIMHPNLVNMIKKEEHKGIVFTLRLICQTGLLIHYNLPHAIRALRAGANIACSTIITE